MTEATPIRVFEPFVVEPVPAPGLWDRLRGRSSREAVLIELMNLLAVTPYADVREGQVAEIVAKAKVLVREVNSELTALFTRATGLIAEDGEVSESDRAGLEKLRAAFDLSPEEATSAAQEALGTIYQATMQAALADQVFTSAERQALERLAAGLGIQEERRLEIYRKHAHDALQAMVTTALADRRYNEGEEGKIKALAESLGAKLAFDPDTERMIHRSRQLAEIEQGKLPFVPTTVILQKGEVCHFSGQVTFNEIRTVTKRVNYRGVTSSVKLFGPVRYRMGSLRFDRVTKEVMTELDKGDLYITNKRILFDGGRKSVNITLGRITNFTSYKDGLQIEKSSGKDSYFLGSADWELAGVCLDAILAR